MFVAQAMIVITMRATFTRISAQPYGCLGGTAGNSPAFQRWVWTPKGISPEGTAERPLNSAVPSGLETTGPLSQR